MSKPEWQDWPEEPWGDVLEAIGYKWADDNQDVLRCIAAQARALACVNALAGRRNPAAVGEVIEAAKGMLLKTAGLEELFEGQEREKFSAQWRNIVQALAKLDQEPTDA